MFSCTPNGAEASSIFYSIIETAKENALNPYQYVKFLLEQLPSRKTSDSLEDLLPWSACLPDVCRVPAKTSNIQPQMPKLPKSKGPLHQALLKMREKFELDASS